MLNTNTVVTTNFQKFNWHLQLGNQLFLYCACRYVSNQLNCKFSFPKNWEGLNLIECDLGVNRDYNDVILLDGFFQHTKYVNKNWFTIKINNINNKYLNYNLDEWCIVHFRGTDFLYKSYVLNKDYYRHAKNKMLSINRNLKFLVVTDDICESKKFINADDYVSVSKEDDFKFLSVSKYLVISQSTFSWWASFLNENLLYCISPSGWNEPFDKLLNHNHINFLI